MLSKPYNAHGRQPLFSVGSSGIEMALGALWEEQGLVKPQTQWPAPGRAKSLLVVSGSCSPVTAKQIAYAEEHDFAVIGLDTQAVAISTDLTITIAPYVHLITELLRRGIPVIVHTSLGVDDARFVKTYDFFAKQGLSQNDVRIKTAELYGTALGQIALGVAGKTKLERLVIAGGDTSGYVARAMSIEAVEMIATVAPGAPLCKAYAPGTVAQGLQVNFKGGQVGAEDYFINVLEGKTTS